MRENNGDINRQIKKLPKRKSQRILSGIKINQRTKRIHRQGKSFVICTFTCKCQIRIYEIRFYLGMSRIAGYITL